MEVKVEVADHAYKFSSGLAKAIKKIVVEIEDNGGFNVGDDLAGIVSVALTDLVPALTHIAELKQEAKNDKIEFYKGILLGVSDLVEVFVEKEV